MYGRRLVLVNTFRGWAVLSWFAKGQYGSSSIAVNGLSQQPKVGKAMWHIMFSSETDEVSNGHVPG